MDIKAYIETGVLEAYVLGALPEAELQQVQADIARHPELAAEVRAIEEAMFQYASAEAVTPPADAQEKIWNAIKESSNNSVQVPKQIPLTPQGGAGVWKFAAAAAILLLAGSAVLNFILWSDNGELKQEQKEMIADMGKLGAEQKKLADALGVYQRSTKMMADNSMRTIVMHTQVAGHPMAATLYWNKEHGEAYVAMNALPEPPKGMQYQLWVIQDGKPVSMGTLPNSMANSAEMQKVNMAVTAGEAFAISLEKEGGNPTPTTVYVMGKA